MLGVVLGVGAFAALGLRAPVRGLYALFALVVFDGALRKWVIPGLQAEVFLAKDLLLAAIYAGAALGGKWRRKSAEPRALLWLRLAWWALVVLVGADVAFSRVDDTLMVVSGVRAALLYVPLTWVIPALLDGERVAPLAEPTRALALLAMGIAVLAMWQATLPAGHPANVYAHAGDVMRVARMGSGGVVRATGTFSYISGLADFAQFVPAGLALAIMHRPLAARWGLLGVGSASLMAVASGSRAAVYGAGIAAAVLATGVVRGKRIQGKYVLAMCAVVGVGVFAVARLGVASAFLERREFAGDTEERWMGMLLRPIFSTATLPVMGYGVGSGYQQNVVKESAALTGFQAYDEVRHSRLFLELGLLGGLLELAIRALQIGIVVGAIRNRSGVWAGPGLAALVYVAWFGWSLPTYDPVASILLSGVCGFAVLGARRTAPTEEKRSLRMSADGRRTAAAGSGNVAEGLALRSVPADSGSQLCR